MRLINKLLRALHNGFNRDPGAVPVLQLEQTSGHYQLRLEDNTLTLDYDDLPQTTWDLSQDTLTYAQLAEDLAAYFSTVTWVDIGQAGRATRTMARLDTSDTSYLISRYSATLWTLMDSYTSPLRDAKAAISDMLAQLFLHTAEVNWLDEWASYLGFIRQAQEADSTYRQRMINALLKPKCNNIALELILSEHYDLNTSVTDDLKYPGVFNAIMSFDLLGADDNPKTSLANATALINTVKAAGTKLGAFQLSASRLLQDSVTVSPLDNAGLTQTTVHYYDGTYLHNGAIHYQSDFLRETLDDF